MNINELEKWHFEVTEEGANYLLDLVLKGKKRATSSSFLGYGEMSRYWKPENLV